jgi:hypothetical protein
MKNNDFFICEEDNVFDQLSALYEDLQPSVYSGVPAIDPSLEWDNVDDFIGDGVHLQEDAFIDEDYGAYDVDFQNGDILLVRVHQDNKEKRNLAHLVRPFLVIHATARMVYGFQLSTSNPATLSQYLVDVPNYADCGLNGPGKFVLNMVRGAEMFRLVKRIGHITFEQRQAILDKLYEIRDNKDGLYDDCLLNDRLDVTIRNVAKINC